jgi:hypothetical protein
MIAWANGDDSVGPGEFSLQYTVWRFEEPDEFALDLTSA